MEGKQTQDLFNNQIIKRELYLKWKCGASRNMIKDKCKRIAWRHSIENRLNASYNQLLT